MSEKMEYNGEKWKYYPLPFRLNKAVVTDKVQNYDQIISDLETLTGLEMCIKPTVLAVDLPFIPELGAALMPGLIITLNPKTSTPEGYYLDKYIIGHELTHCLLMQHLYYNFFFVQTQHEDMARECGTRIKQGDLEPIYKYKGKTMSEIVPSPNCLL